MKLSDSSKPGIISGKLFWTSEFNHAILDTTRYESSIICTEDGEPPADHSLIYQPSTYPGSCLPHVWMQDGTALHDRLAKGFTLLKFATSAANTVSFEAALRERGVSLDVLEISDDDIRQVYE